MLPVSKLNDNDVSHVTLTSLLFTLKKKQPSVLCFNCQLSTDNFLSNLPVNLACQIWLIFYPYMSLMTNEKPL